MTLKREGAKIQPTPPGALGRRTLLGLVPGLWLAGCRSTSTKEHENDGLGAAVLVRAQWRDGDVKLPVGGLLVQLVRRSSAGPPELVATATTKADGPLLFEGLAPGRYRLVLRGPGIDKEVEEFRLRADRRVTVRLEIQGSAGVVIPVERLGAGDAVAEGALFVLKGIGVVLLVATVLGLILILAAIDDDDDDDDPCSGHRPGTSRTGRCPACGRR